MHHKTSTTQDYYPFGMLMPTRTWDAESSYRFGFNTQERVDEISGKGNHNTALYWEYDTRLGRRWNLDPKYFPNVSRYSVFTNNPIFFDDNNGDIVKYAGFKEFVEVNLKAIFNQNFRKKLSLLRLASAEFTFKKYEKNNDHAKPLENIFIGGTIRSNAESKDSEDENIAFKSPENNQQNIDFDTDVKFDPSNPHDRITIQYRSKRKETIKMNGDDGPIDLINTKNGATKTSKYTYKSGNIRYKAGAHPNSNGNNTTIVHKRSNLVNVFNAPGTINRGSSTIPETSKNKTHVSVTVTGNGQRDPGAFRVKVKISE